MLCGAGAVGTDEDGGPAAGDSGTDRFTQRPGWEQPAVAEAGLSVDDKKGEVLQQASGFAARHP